MRTLFLLLLAAAPVAAQYSYCSVDATPFDTTKWTPSGVLQVLRNNNCQYAGEIQAVTGQFPSTPPPTGVFGVSAIFDYREPSGQAVAWATQVAWNPYDGTVARVFQKTETSWIVVAQWSTSLPAPGKVFASSFRPKDGLTPAAAAGLTLRWGSDIYYYPFPSTMNYTIGFTAMGTATADQIPGMTQAVTWAAVGAIDTVAPANVSSSSIVTSTTGGVLTAQWGAVSDNSGGIGGIRYAIYKNGAYYSDTASTTFSMGIQTGETFVLGIAAYDAHRNFSTMATKDLAVVPPVITEDSRRTGIHALGSHWGGMGEQIDVRGMNLNFSVPLLKAMSRGASVGIGLSYNSQNWRYDGSVWQMGGDVGFGFGWRLAAGSIFPVYSSGGSLLRYIFTDSIGTEYKLDVNTSGNIWTSKDSSYVYYDAYAHRLYFKNGAYWQLDSVSGSSEQDAGTRYPTRVYDVNGNYVEISYMPQVGGSSPNSSARINTIDDIRGPLACCYYYTKPYQFTYNTDAIPHLTSITNTISTSEAYTFTYSGSSTLYEPFGNASRGSFVKLNSFASTGTGLTHTMEHNQYGEMTKLIYPYGGELRWNYATQSYTNNKQSREVSSRDLLKTSGATPVSYVFTHPGGDSSLPMHSQTTLADPSGVGKRVWTFSTSNDFKLGLATVYEEQDSSGGSWLTKSKSEMTWAQSSSSNPYVSESLATLDPGQSYQKQSKTTQTIDAYGNTTGSVLYGYASLTTAQRSTACYYTQPSQFTARYILDRVYYCSTIENGVTLTPMSYGYDGGTLAAIPNYSRLWEDPGTTVRGNATSTYDGYQYRNLGLNTAGQPVTASDGNLSQAITYSGGAGSVVPSQIVPNGNTGLGTSLSWNGFLGLTQVSGGNGSTVGYGYDSYARLQTTYTPDGGVISYTYSTSPAYVIANTNGRTTKTYFDGLGRPIKTETPGPQGTITVDTEYDSCACSPMGKMKRVSLPYFAGGTVYWTTYTYDGLGRTLSVAQANNSGTTTYLYQGNTVKLTSPSGKWKQYDMDAAGRMTQVTEPRPGGGTYTTSYTYNIGGKLIGVSMPRDGVTQTRTFSYDGTQSRLLSATNPENGTVSYVYNTDGTVQSKTDAKSIRSEFTYDAYKRVIQTRKLLSNTEDRCQRVDYFYDEGGGANNGRLTRMRWNWTVNGQNQAVGCAAPANGGVMGFEETYTYNAAGRITSKTLGYTRSVYGGVATANLTGTWSYNNEGKVTAIGYPSHNEGNYIAGRQVSYSYDSLARLSGVDTKLASEWNNAPAWQSVISGAAYNAFGSITALTHLGLSETRQYNVLGQMTRMTKSSLIDIEYRFSATANDGKIVSQKNWLSGEDVTYQYDELERLISAATTNNTAWGLSFSYDGFGNRLSQAVTQGSGPVNSVLVDANTNRISSSGFAYDANGNMTQMPKGAGSMTLNYDYSNRMTSATHPDGSEAYAYAPDNRRIWRSAGQVSCQLADDNGNMQYPYGATPGEQVIFYSPNGQKMGVYCVTYSPIPQLLTVTAHEENVYFGARLVAKRIFQYGSTTVSDFTADRLQSKGDGSKFYPYGESKTGAAGDDKEQFATYTRDAGTGLDYADQRWYASGLGRFLTSDTSKSSAKGQTPISYNMFLYVEARPNVHTDRFGRMIDRGEDNCGEDSPLECSPPGPGTPTGPPNVPIPDPLPPQPDPTPLDKAKNAARFIVDKTEWSDKCKNTLKAAGVGGKTDGSADDIIKLLRAAADSAVFLPGEDSTYLVRDLYANGANPSLANLVSQTQTVGQEFLAHPSTSAMAQLGGNNIFIRSSSFANYGSGYAVAVIMHELLHNFTGLTDPDLQRNLNLNGAGGSNDITIKLISDCLN